MKRSSALARLFVLLSGSVGAATLDLAGSWEFRLDAKNEGVTARWFAQPFEETVRLPGALQEQGKGFTPGPDTVWWMGPERRTKLTPDFPFLERYNRPEDYRITAFLLPDKHYIGPAWYARNVDIPAGWAGQRIVLSLERCHWETQVWVDGRAAGRADSLATPHEYDLSAVLSPGRHRLAIRVDNGVIVDLGAQPHSVSDQTAGTWNGIVGRIELRTTPRVWLDDLQILPNVARRSVRIRGTVGHFNGGAAQGEVRLEVARPDGVPVVSRTLALEATALARQTFETELALGPDAPLWEEFTPVLHRLRATLAQGDFRDTREVAFGLREFSVAGTQFVINGRPVFLRGNTDCAVFARTGYAPMDFESWRQIWRIYKEWGFNHARFHSWCPPEAAFAAADETGIYLAPEVSEWSWVRLPEQEAFFRRESAAMLRRFGNHPSFVMMALGNEIGGDKAIFSRLLAEWKQDSRRVYSIKANSRANPPEIDYEVCREFSGERIRYQSGWPPKPLNTLLQARPPQTTLDWRVAVAKSTKPLIAHETGQFCAYPDVQNEPRNFTGYLKPSYLAIARDQLAERGLLDQVPAFVRASGAWQIELYKEEIEASLRTPGLAGFQLLQLNDFSGQGTAPVGLLDATWTRKSYAAPARFREFCGPTVALARLPRRVWLTSETLGAAIEVTHYGMKDLPQQPVAVTILDAAGRELWRTALAARDFGRATAQAAGEIKVPLARLAAPAKYTLQVELPGTNVRNQWAFWVYPDALPAVPAGRIHIASTFDDGVRARLAGGGTVLLLPRSQGLTGALPMCFTTFYWTTFERTGGQSSAAGLLCDPAHPLFRDFPTEAHANWQWWDLLTRASPMILDEPDRRVPWPKAHRPLVQMIDGWKINRKLAVVTEARVGTGRLAICTIDLDTDLPTRPVARQFRASLLRYLQSTEFSPADEVSPEAVAALFTPGRRNHLGEIGAIVTVTSAADEFPATHLTDGNAATIWHTPWGANAAPLPHAITVDLRRPTTVKGLRVLPRQDNANGRIAEFAIYASADGNNWGDPLIVDRWANTPEEQEVHFPRPSRTRYLKLEIRAGHAGHIYTSAAEFDIVLPDALPSDG